MSGLSSPLAQRLLESVRAALEPPARVFVAVSGGVDSMLLLHLLARGGRETGPSITALHVNHGLRGAESDGDEALVAEYCRKNGLGFRSHRLRWERKPSQADCREKRWDFFRSCLSPGDLLFLAHHRDDQAETVLLRLLRGSGLRGLGAMAPREGAVRRPLLAFGKDEILRLAGEWGVPWREDSSNQSSGYERNWLRLELLPLLESRRPGLAERLAALAEEARALPLPAPLEEAYGEGQGWSLSRAPSLAGVPGAALATAFRLSRAHVQGLRSLLAKGQGQYTAEGCRFHLSCGLLLAEREGRFRPELLLRGEGEAHSPLGVWRSSGGPLRALSDLGPRPKKQFQRERVPVFFRPALPLLWAEGKARLLWGQLPSSVRWTPSPLAEWWLTPSVASGGPPDESAKK